MDRVTADRSHDRAETAEPAPAPAEAERPLLLRTAAPPPVSGLVRPRSSRDGGASRVGDGAALTVGHGAPLVDVRRHAAPALAPAAPPVVRRKGGQTPQLTSKTVLAGLRRIPVVEEKLDEQLAQGPTGLEHVERALKAFDKHLALTSPANAFVNEAIRIATVIDATAAELARSINDPTLKGRIASELVAAYRAELTAALSSTKDSPARAAQTEKALDLATVVVGDDPVMLFMTDKVKRDDAARRIREMAVAAKLGPSEMLRILRRRFEMELAAHTKAEVDAGARGADDIWEKDAVTQAETQGKGGFDLADLIGEISPTFYSAMVAVKPGAKATKPASFGANGLDLTAKAKSRLDDLEQAVMHADLSGLTLTPTQLATEQAKSGTALSAKQSEHFHRLRAEETADAANYESEGKSPREYVVGKFTSRYGLDAPAAGTLVDDVLTALASVPLTLSSKLESLFKPRDDNASLPFYGSAYKSEPALMQEEVDLSELVGKPDRGTKAMSIGQPDADFTRSRGENYMRWRRDKDERETGYHGLGADDLPIFAAVNPNFHDTKGGNANLATWDSDAKAWTGKTYGENYYGDVHLLLKDSVRTRSTLIARGQKTTKGRRIERTDLTFLLADMCRLWMYDYVDALVAQARVPGQVVLTNMDAEVHVYGGFDMATDVDAIYLQPAAFAATDGAAQRCKDFAVAHGITVHDIGTMPPGYDITAKQGVQGGIDLKAALNP